MIKPQSSRRSLLGGLAASILAPLAGLLGGRAKASEEPKYHLSPEEAVRFYNAHPLLSGPCDAERRIRAEKDRLNECILDPTISAERRSQYYAAQQALAWAIDPGGFMDPSQAINEDLCRWLAWPGMEQPVYRGVEPGPSYPVEISSVPS